MLTATMPALSRALDGQLPPQVVRAVMQALGNCGQDSIQRGGMAVMPNTLQGVSGAGPQGWNPYSTQNINNNGGWIPYDPNGRPFIDMSSGGGYRAGDWYSTHYGSPNYTFFSPIVNELSSLYGSPTNFFGGNSSFENIFASNVTAENVTNLGDERVGVIKLVLGGGPPGDDGSNGSDGGRGPSGPPGDDGMLAGAGFVPKMPRKTTAVIRQVRGQKINLLPYVLNVTFDPDTCALTVVKRRPPPLVREVTSTPVNINYYGPGQ
jgi:hypothetical protein